MTEQCQACSCLCGEGHEQSLNRYREHMICRPCWRAWKVLDKRLGRQAEWEEFLHPVQLKSGRPAKKEAGKQPTSPKLGVNTGGLELCWSE